MAEILASRREYHFLLNVRKHKLVTRIRFLICGNDTEHGKLKDFFDRNKPSNVKLMNGLPQDDYDRMIAPCDVGMIFLDHRFTITNFPSRLLSYM